MRVSSLRPRVRRLRWGVLVPVMAAATATAIAACGGVTEPDLTTARPSSVAAMPSPESGANAKTSAADLDAHTRVDGRAFPDKVISLTWDDGPDANTLELAEYLAEKRISATFFVVASWVDGLSDDPGDGHQVFGTGYEHIPILGDLVALGHRLGNHTLNHVVLRGTAGMALIDRELRENQRNIDPFLSNELRLFRVPGGGWGSVAQSIVDGDPYLTKMVGPVSWDIDRKDWDESLHCRGPSSTTDCERAGPGHALRMKPAVVAARYVASIDAVGHGIVLLHDRVGHVGSTYGLAVAQAMVPQLEAKGYVFAAPVLRFSPPSLRRIEELGEVSSPEKWELLTLRLGDVNGDGRDDVCGKTAMGVRCAISAASSLEGDGRMSRTIFRAPRVYDEGATPKTGTVRLADVTGDGRHDVCVVSGDAIACAASNVVGELGAFRPWGTFDGARDAELRLADVDGDGRADVCSRTASGIACAHNAGKRFEPSRAWLTPEKPNASAAAIGPMLPQHAAIDFAKIATIHLADVDGDGKSDACGHDGRGVVCAMSTGRGFARFERWSSPGSPSSDVVDTTDASKIRFGDLNGDGREDLCVIGKKGVSCALSSGRTFTRTSPWLSRSELEAQGWNDPDRAATIQLGDVNGDGRADLCGRGAAGIVCALAP